MNHFQEDAALVGTNKAPGGHLLCPETRQGRRHVDIVQHGKRQEQYAHGQQQVYEAAVTKLDGLRSVPGPFFEKIHIPERNNPDFIVLAFVHPEILFTPIQDVAMPGLQVCTWISHHKADAASGVAHTFIMGRIDLGHNFAPHQHVRSFQDGVPEIFIDAADSKRIIRIIIQGYDLANRILVTEMGIDKLPAHHTAVLGNAPVGLVSLHQVIAEHLKEGAVRCHRAAIDSFSVNVERCRRCDVGHATSLFYFRKIVLQVLVQPITHHHVILIGNHINPVRILLERIRGQLPLDIRRQ